MTDATMTHVSERTARRASLGRHVLPYAMLSPAVLVTLAIVFFPMLQTAWMSLHDYVLFRPNDFTWVGLDNFKAALSDEVFWISLKHTIIWHPKPPIHASRRLMAECGFQRRTPLHWKHRLFRVGSKR